MTHFEAYHWEDHVPRAGSWKFNLAAGLVALGLIYAAVPKGLSEAPATAPTRGTQDLKASVSSGPAKSWSAYCTTAADDHADS